MYIKKTKYYNPQKCLILAVNELDKKKKKTHYNQFKKTTSGNEQPF